MSTERKPRIVIDFDGVLNSYASGWTGAASIPDAPTDGAREFVVSLLGAGWDVVVCSTRAETVVGVGAIIEWLATYGFPALRVEHGKPPALVYLDDRALRFDGLWPTLAMIETAARPWNK